MTLQHRFQQALAAHRQGALDRARNDYLAILEQRPRHHQARHLLGVCAFQAGHADEAISHINTAIAQAPGVAEYHNNLGEVLRNRGRLEEAEKAYGRALELTPDYADAHNNLALILQSHGRLDAAIEHLRKALQLEPQAPQTAANLGNLLRMVEDYPGACDYFRRALDLAPAFAEARLALCQILVDQEHSAQASECAREGLQIDARDPAALCAGACVAISLAQYDQAAQHLAAAARQNPQSPPVQMTLGRLLLISGEPHEALRWLERAAQHLRHDAQLQALLSRACLELNRLDHAHAAISKARELEPGNQALRVQFAKVCRYQDRLADAAQCLDEVLAEDPDNVPATAERAEVFLLTGETGRARQLLERTLTREPDNHSVREQLASIILSAGEAGESVEQLLRIIADDPERITSYRLLSQAKRFTAEDQPLREALSRQLTSRELAPPLAAAGYFALGKMFADCGHYRQAFGNFQRANDLRRKQVDYDADAHAAFVQERIEAFTSPRMERLSEYGNSSRVPIIIAGMPRSGTTLAERILASHALVAAGGEVDALTRMNPRPVGGAPTQHYLGLALDALDGATLDQLGRDYLTRLCREHPTAGRITDKTPHNFLHLGMAGVLFPQAPIIHCLRHPMATCLSIYSMEMNLGNEFGYRFDDLAQYYGQYRRMMAHWQQLMPGRIYDLNYERLVTDFETVCRELLGFCGLAWDPRCLEFHTTQGTVLTASDWQVRQPLYSSAVNHWRHYQTELEPLRQALENHGVALD